ncbi:MAG: hypothetical protein HF308_15395 [Ignavibacteria bacterium]|jgi:hypothetical protein|nr:hypothetical protein [Ignavibacteria bacterium]MCU7525863.1 hypothetical protein [Ignavibacteria bacterium]
MFYVLFDKNFVALGNKKTYPVESWSLRKRANEFDELKITGMVVDSNIEPVYVTLNDDNGHIKYIALSGNPEIKDGKATINAVDLKTILNTEGVIDLTGLTELNTLSDLYTKVFAGLYSHNKNFGYSLRFDFLESDTLNVDPTSIVAEISVANIWKTIQNVNAFYGTFLEFSANMATKELIITVKRINNRIGINPDDFNVLNHTKITSGTNKVVAGDKTLTAATVKVYYLLNDNTVVDQGDANYFDTNGVILQAHEGKIIYPAKVKYIQEEDPMKAYTKAVEELMKQRYNEEFEIDTKSKLGYLLKDVSLSYEIEVANYKKLPVSEIYESSKGERIIMIGKLEELSWQ